MKIAVYTICKNEEKHIRDWIANVSDADYVCLADTGSSDGTFRIFKDFATLRGRGEPHYVASQISVQPFRFDTARNAALALVPPDVDVCISLDLDERLCRGWRQMIEQEWEADTGRLNVEYVRETLAPFAINTRVHARSGYYWKEPCHEGLYPWMRPTDIIKDVPMLKIFHYPDETKSRGQYLELLAWALHEEPWNLRRIFYYARELLMMQEYEKAAGWFRKYIEIDELNEIPPWYENQQARALLQLAEGALREQSERGRQKPQRSS